MSTVKRTRKPNKNAGDLFYTSKYVRLTKPLMKAVQWIGKKEHLSVNELMNRAIANMVSEYCKRHGKPQELMKELALRILKHTRPHSFEDEALRRLRINAYGEDEDEQD
jgi:hypothetical protein